MQLEKSLTTRRCNYYLNFIEFSFRIIWLLRLEGSAELPTDLKIGPFPILGTFRSGSVQVPFVFNSTIAHSNLLQLPLVREKQLPLANLLLHQKAR